MKTFCTILAFAAFAASAQAIKLAEEGVTEETPATTVQEEEQSTEFTCEIPIAHCDDFYYGAVAELYRSFLAPYFDGVPHAIHDLLVHHIEDAEEGATKDDILAEVNASLEVAGQASHAWMKWVVGHAFLDAAEDTYEHAHEIEDGSGELVFWEDDEHRDVVDEEHDAALEALDLDKDDIEEYFDDFEGDELYEDWLGEDLGDDHVEHCDIEAPTEEVNAALVGLHDHAIAFHDLFLEEAERILAESNRVIFEEIQAAFAAHDDLTEEVIEEYFGHWEEYLHELSEQAYFAIEFGALDYCYAATDVFAETTSLETSHSYEILDHLSADLQAQYDEAYPSTDGDSTTDDHVDEDDHDDSPAGSDSDA